MAGIAVDNLLHAATRRASSDGTAAVNCLARFIVTKHSWRGKYRRVLCVTPTSLFTQHPENLQVTNIWSFVDDPDIDGVVIPPESEGTGEHELVLSVRNDKKVRVCVDCMLHHTTWSPLEQVQAAQAHMQASSHLSVHFLSTPERRRPAGHRTHRSPHPWVRVVACACTVHVLMTGARLSSFQRTSCGGGHGFLWCCGSHRGPWNAWNQPQVCVLGGRTCCMDLC